MNRSAAGMRGRHAFVAAWLACHGLACQTRPADRESDQPPAATPTSHISVPAPPAAVGPTANPTAGPAANPTAGPALPEPVGQTAIGEFLPAPWLDRAERVAVLTHAGTPYIAAAGTGFLQVFDARGRPIARADAPGAAHVLEVVGTDPDPAADAGERVFLALGRGAGRDARAASLSVVVHAFDGRALGPAEAIPLAPSTRAQVVGIAARDPAGRRMWLGAFESKYIMALYEVERGERGFQARVVDRLRVPLSLAAGDPDADGTRDLYIARPYGDSADSPGDVFRWRDGTRDLLPSVRGARAVLVHGDSVLVADGWHKDYGRQANALITRITPADSGVAARVLAHVAGRHGYDRLRVGDIDGDGAPDLVAAGNGPAIVLFALAPVRDTVPTLGTADARDIAIGDLDAPGPSSVRDEVVIAGETPGIWRFRD